MSAVVMHTEMASLYRQQENDTITPLKQQDAQLSQRNRAMLRAIE